MTRRLFTDEELEGMGRRSLDRLQDLIRAGDTETALRQAGRMHNESLAMHDMLRDWVTILLSEIYGREGTTGLDDAMAASIDGTWLPTVRLLHGKGNDLQAWRAKVKMYVAGLRGHQQPLKVEEDEEKVIIHLCPCGSGGRQVLDGRYRDGEFATVREASALTWGRSQLPVYCTDDAMMEKRDIEVNGYPFVVIDAADPPGSAPCRMLIYKNPADIPSRYYTRLGLEKPAGLPDGERTQL